jgi:hypothetical protein
MSVICVGQMWIQRIPRDLERKEIVVVICRFILRAESDQRLEDPAAE